MARRKKYHYVTDPVLKASVVVESFVDKATKNLSVWAKSYETNVKTYIGNEARQQWAALKLAGFYQGLTDPDVRRAISDAVNRAKTRQYEVVSTVIEKAPVPAVPDAAKRTAKKVAEILGVTTIAPAV